MKNKAQERYYEKNREQLIEKSKQYYHEHSKALNQRASKWKEENREHCRIRDREYMAEYREKKREQLKAWRQQPRNRIANNVRCRMWHVLKGLKPAGKTETLLGCSFEDFKLYIESSFQKGMNWDNYGDWEIDHIIPCVSFDLSIEDEQKKCFHYTNLQPLWKTDNRRKYIN